VVRDTGSSAKHLSDPAPFDSGSGNALESAAFSGKNPAPFRPFENLPPMPADVNEAFEMFKLAVISHKLGGWQDIALEDVLAILDALKQLASAPAE